MEIDDKRLEADLAEMKQKEKLELEILKLSYEITEKKKNIFKKNEWTFKDFIGPVLTSLTLIVSVTSIFITFKIQSKQLEINTHIQGSTNLRELLSWVVDPSKKKHDMAMQQLKYYGSQTLPVYLDAIITDTAFSADDMANNISFIINLSCENEAEKQQIIYDLNSFFQRQVFQKIDPKYVQEIELEDLNSVLTDRIYPVLEKINYNGISRDSLLIYNKIKIEAAASALGKAIQKSQTVENIQKLLMEKTK